ncbi:hypothetical protein N7E81_18140 [Reichenbachiella carrageenanivorans]|uniref:Lipoprotein n=1 Tax=Reichenbachiella carrageenanivorans TaxID=2979869 RepID=A0ABY6CZD1_9BACT|nr:hypothetical protein [Reichenbachiella carrageenanivorans]UXX79276.1 hypothetical protein N7E81_18140 [Reichenbachiella carrageenanivorans]
MKRLFGILLTTSALILHACTTDIDESTDELVGEDLAIADVNLEINTSDLVEEIDDAADFATTYFDEKEGRSLGERWKKFNDCVTVTNDEATSIRTVDFGEEGCVGIDGRVRKGKILIAHEGERNEAGFKRTVTFEGFSVDTIQVEGVRVLIYLSGTGTEKKYEATLTNGKITMPDGFILTRSSSRTVIATFDEDGLKTQVARFGTASGTNRLGITYETMIEETTPLVSKMECREGGFLPHVSGILTVNIESKIEKTIDFGDGTCDQWVTITQDGESREVKVEPRGKRIRPPKKD